MSLSLIHIFVLRKVLARDRDDRYATAAELASDLDAFVASQGSAEEMPTLTAEILDALFPGEREERTQWLRRARGYLREPGRATMPPPVPVAGASTPSMLSLIHIFGSVDRATHATITVEKLGGVDHLFVVGANVGTTEQTFNPDQGEWEPHGWLLTLGAD